MLDFSYLNKFAGKNVEVVIKTNPKYKRGSEEMNLFGKLFQDNGIMRVHFGENLHTPEHDGGKFLPTMDEGKVCGSVWNTSPHSGGRSAPYLGTTQTIWSIKRLDDNSHLLEHRKVGELNYEVIGERGELIARLNGFNLPYSTPYDPLRAVSPGENHLAEFFAWRNRVLSVL